MGGRGRDGDLLLVLAILCFEEKPDVVIIYATAFESMTRTATTHCNFSLFYDAPRA